MGDDVIQIPYHRVIRPPCRQCVTSGGTGYYPRCAESHPRQMRAQPRMVKPYVFITEGGEGTAVAESGHGDLFGTYSLQNLLHVRFRRFPCPKESPMTVPKVLHIPIGGNGEVQIVLPIHASPAPFKQNIESALRLPYGEADVVFHVGIGGVQAHLKQTKRIHSGIPPDLPTDLDIVLQYSISAISHFRASAFSQQSILRDGKSY